MESEITFLGMPLVTAIFGGWVIGFAASIPLSLYVIFYRGKNIPKEKIDVFIPLFIFLGLLFSWVLVDCLLVVVIYDLIETFEESRRMSKITTGQIDKCSA